MFDGYIRHIMADPQAKVVQLATNYTLIFLADGSGTTAVSHVVFLTGFILLQAFIGGQDVHLKGNFDMAFDLLVANIYGFYFGWAARQDPSLMAWRVAVGRAKGVIVLVFTVFMGVLFVAWFLVRKGIKMYKPPSRTKWATEGSEGYPPLGDIV